MVQSLGVNYMGWIVLMTKEKKQQQQQKSTQLFALEAVWIAPHTGGASFATRVSWQDNENNNNLFIQVGYQNSECQNVWVLSYAMKNNPSIVGYQNSKCQNVWVLSYAMKNNPSIVCIHHASLHITGSTSSIRCHNDVIWQLNLPFYHVQASHT